MTGYTWQERVRVVMRRLDGVCRLPLDPKSKEGCKTSGAEFCFLRQRNSTRGFLGVRERSVCWLYTLRHRTESNTESKLALDYAENSQTWMYAKR